jgi:hypothetical protein
MRMPDPAAPVEAVEATREGRGRRVLPGWSFANISVYRKCAACEQEEEDAPRVQRSASPDAPEGVTAPPAVEQVLRGGGGTPLHPQTRAFFEQRFGHAFGDVRIHTDTKAAASARSVNALAYTVGRNIVFGAGQYAPHSPAGRRLLAHELTHVVQQSGAAPRVGAAVQRKTEGAGAAPDDVIDAILADLQAGAAADGAAPEGSAAEPAGAQGTTTEAAAQPAGPAETPVQPAGPAETPVQPAGPAETPVQPAGPAHATPGAPAAAADPQGGGPVARALVALTAFKQRASAEQKAMLAQQIAQKKEDGSIPPVMQRKAVGISSPGDRWEREADAVADRVLREPQDQCVPSRAPLRPLASGPVLQRQDAASNSTELGVFALLAALILAAYYAMRAQPKAKAKETAKTDAQVDVTPRRGYLCTAKCQSNGAPQGAYYVFGTSTVNCGEATRTAKANVPRGEYPRHCSCTDTEGFIGKGTQCENHVR